MYIGIVFGFLAASPPFGGAYGMKEASGCLKTKCSVIQGLTTTNLNPFSSGINFDNHHLVNATTLRELYFKHINLLPYDMGDSHSSIINCDTKIVNGLSITSHDHKVSKRVEVPTDLHESVTESVHHNYQDMVHQIVAGMILQLFLFFACDPASSQLYKASAILSGMAHEMFSSLRNRLHNWPEDMIFFAMGFKSYDIARDESRAEM
ncbi:hypothetical protein H5410_009883 [Solanum commersonii]|uniref:Uncharacterized protein n=1 Tax=Solanum commersonii TaxID=4109 RepID=A0A9J6AJP8_SOLCO|nr:hypothetical protein H5410_009883 [Solanum commersonii]